MSGARGGGGAGDEFVVEEEAREGEVEIAGGAVGDEEGFVGEFEGEEVEGGVFDCEGFAEGACEVVGDVDFLIGGGGGDVHGGEPGEFVAVPEAVVLELHPAGGHGDGEAVLGVFDAIDGEFFGVGFGEEGVGAFVEG